VGALLKTCNQLSLNPGESGKYGEFTRPLNEVPSQLQFCRA